MALFRVVRLFHNIPGLIPKRKRKIGPPVSGWAAYSFAGR